MGMEKILVIDDEAILRGEVLEWLTFEGYEALGAGDGIEGIELAFKHLPDLIICDITMPRLDGYGVLLEVQSNPMTVSIPFIFLTARASHEDLRQGMALGADDYITKPFTHHDLIRAVQTRLEKKVVLHNERRQEIEQLEQSLMLERQQRMLKARLVAMFSHDFRNPLTSILSSNSLLRDYGNRMESGRQKSHFNRIEASVRQLVQMLDDMIVVMQMDSPHFEFRPEHLDAGPFFKQIADEFQAIYGETHVVLFEDRFVDGAVVGDKRLLRSIANNLIANAIKYSPRGGRVKCKLTEAQGFCTLTVEDEGIGISADDQARLFEAFQRGSNTGDITGTGLGLAIVKQAVDLHHGRVWVESVAGQGTKVSVSLPAALAETA
jgi:signal transduction histidine kinase